MENSNNKNIFKAFLRLEKEVRASKDVRHLAFVMANHSNHILPYTQAVVWKKTITGYSILSISATSSVNHKSPYIVWLEKNLIPELSNKFSDHVTNVSKDVISTKLKKDWEEYLTDYLIYCPFRSFKGDEVEGGILFIHATAWPEGQTQIVEELRLVFEHTWQLTNQPQKEKWVKKFFSKKKRRYILATILVILIALFAIPVRQTVLAPAEITPKDPILVSSSIEGIINQIDVKPNQQVNQGQILFSLDKITLENKYQQAEKALSVSEEKYRRAYQDAYNNPKSKAELAVLKAEMEKATNELNYSKLLLARSNIKAQHEGIVIFSSPKYWLGRPVKVGEQVMLLAGKDNKQLEVNIPQASMIQINPGDEVKFFPDVDPLSAIGAKVNYASFVATASETGELTYYVSATFNDNKNLPRYGAHGTAKIYGKPVSLFFYLFKRPIVFIQSHLGL